MKVEGSVCCFSNILVLFCNKSDFSQTNICTLDMDFGIYFKSLILKLFIFRSSKSKESYTQVPKLKPLSKKNKTMP